MTDAQPISTDQAPPTSIDQPTIIAKPEDLDYEIAERAYRGTSFSSEKRARADQEGYAAEVNGLQAEMLKLAKTEEQKALLDDEIKRYQQGYLRRYTDYLISHARCMSTMITGGSNFPVRRQQKYGQWADNKREEFLDWERRAKAAIKAKLLDARPEEAKQDAAWQTLAKDIHRSLADIHAIDAGESPYTRSAFVNSIAGKVERLAEGGDIALVDKALELVRY